MGRGATKKTQSAAKPSAAYIGKADRDSMRGLLRDHQSQLKDFMKEVTDISCFAHQHRLRPQLKKLEDAMKGYCKEDLISKALSTAIDTVLSSEDMTESIQTANEVDDAEILEHAGFAAYKEKVENAGEVEVLASERSLVCPLSQTRFVDPVKNAPCGHCFSRAPIMAQLAKKRKAPASVPCPVAGCPAQVTADSLEADPELEELLKTHAKEEKTTQSFVDA